NHPGQPDRGGDPVAPVDRVVVPRRAGVPDEIGTCDPEGTGGQVHHSPRTTNISHAVTTSSPSPATMSVRVVRKSLPTREVISSIVVVRVSHSPACNGRAYRNRWSPCTTRSKSRPRPGSPISVSIPHWQSTIENVGGA